MSPSKKATTHNDVDLETLTRHFEFANGAAGRVSRRFIGTTSAWPYEGY